LGRETTAVAADHPHGVKVDKNREQAKHCANTMIGSGADIWETVVCWHVEEGWFAQPVYSKYDYGATKNILKVN